MRVAIALLLVGCAGGPLRNLGRVPQGKADCAAVARWAEEKSAGGAQREGETSAQDDSLEAAACFRREKDDASARRALLWGLLAQARERVGAPLTVKTGGFEDSLARKLAALAISAHAAGEKDTHARAAEALASIRGRTLDLERGDRKSVGAAGEAVAFIDGDCFFCARSEAYGAADGEHVEQLGRWAGISYVRRDDGREQFLAATKLIPWGQVPPQQLFAEAMRRRGRAIQAATAAALASRAADPSEPSSIEAPLFHLPLRGFSFGDVQRAERENGGAGLKLLVKSDSGEVVVRFPHLLLVRAARDRRFVCPPDGVDTVVRFEGLDGGKPQYRAVILRHEDGVAEGP